MAKIMRAEEAISTFVKDGDTVAFGGFVGSAHAEELSATIQQMYLEKGFPSNLTLIYAAGQGDGKERGLNHLGEEGLVRKVIGGHWNLSPKLQKLALENKMAAYNLPQGVIIHLYREIAAGRPGVITHVGLGTFVDPRLEGGKLNQKAAEEGDLVQVINLNGQEKLFYPSMPIQVGFLRATYADTQGNCTMQNEGTISENIALAQAVKNSGGHVIVQVEGVVDYKSLDTRLVKLPSNLVDAIVVAKPENHMQTYGQQYNPAYSGTVRIPVEDIPPLPLDARKVVARRAAMELIPGAVVNLGIGMPECVAAVAAEDGKADMFLTTEAGTNGGVPAGGLDFGVAANPDCIMDSPSQFDFYDGGGLDLAFLGLAQMDKHGNVNVSKFGPKIAGCGGFINISQNAKKVVFCGTFTAGSLKERIDAQGVVILAEGRTKKLVEQVEQITFSAATAVKTGQPVLYITERAVFELTAEGVALREIAPGIDLEKDVLSQMDFRPIIEDVKLMDASLFAQ